MPIIALVNQKGGCSKSTTLVHFAAWLHRSGKNVVVVDSDAQRSSSTWLGLLEEKIPFEIIQGPDEILERLPELATSTDYLLVDGPAGLSEATRAILFRCDLAVIPCQPTGVDLHSAGDTIRLVKQAQSVRSGPPKGVVFLSRAVRGTKLLDEALAFLEKNQEVTTLKSIIHQRQAIADTFGQGATIWDIPGKPAAEAAKDYEALFKEIMGAIK